MMLIFQIAAGIVLGYIAIQYHVLLLRWLRSALGILLNVSRGQVEGAVRFELDLAS